MKAKTCYRVMEGISNGQESQEGTEYYRIWAEEEHNLKEPQNNR